MSAKNPTINLIDFRKSPKLYHRPEKGMFQIESMKNTISHKAGDYMKEEEVERLISLGFNINVRAPREADYK